MLMTISSHHPGKYPPLNTQEYMTIGLLSQLLNVTTTGVIITEANVGELHLTSSEVDLPINKESHRVTNKTLLV